MNRATRNLGVMASRAMLGLLLYVGAASGGSLGIDVEEIGSDRQEAERLAIEYALNEVMPRYLENVTYNDEVQAFFGRKLDAIERRKYRPLLKRFRPSVDAAGSGGYLLEGRMLLETRVLEKWASECMRSDACRPETAADCPTERLSSRFSFYIVPIDVTETELTASERETRKQFMNTLSSKLGDAGFDIKRSAQKAQAEFMIRLVDSRFEQQAEIKTMSFTVEILDNGDESFVASADGTASGAILVSDLELTKDLLQRASDRTVAQIRQQAIDWADLEVVYYADAAMNRNAARATLEDRLIALFGVPIKEQDAFVSAIDLRIVDDGPHSVYSVEIPHDQCMPYENVLKTGLRDIAVGTMGLIDLREKVQKAGRKISFYDVADCPEVFCADDPLPWEADIEAMIVAGRLDNPPGINQNVVDTLRHLRDEPGNAGRVAKVGQRVVDTFLDQHRDAVSKEQYPLAGRYLDRAENAMKAAGIDDAARVADARAALARLVAVPALPTPVQAPPASSPPPSIVASGAPLLVFPEIEARLRSFVAVAREKKGLLGVVADRDGIASVTVNGQDLEFDPATASNRDYIDLPGADIWQFSLPTDADGTLTVVVRDRAGQATERRLQVDDGQARIATGAGWKDGQVVLEKGGRWALLIANQAYTKGWSPLETPHADVTALKSVLVGRYGFPESQVIVIKDATTKEMTDALYDIHGKVGDRDSLIIYYAGHGHQDQGFGGKGFWIPVDGLSPAATTQPPQSSWLPNSLVHDITKASRARHVLLISDSCYSGTFRSRGFDPVPYAANLDFFYDIAGRKSRRAITSGDLEPVSDGGGHGKSVFAHHLVEVLRGSDRAVNAEQLFQDVQRSVSSAARQTPQYFRLQASGDAGGDFVFVPRG